MAFGDTAAQMDWVDILLICIYFAVVLGVAFWSSCRASTNNAQSYFLAGRSMHWIPIGASTFATNVGAQMFVGLAGSAAATGVSVTMFEWHAMWMLLLLGWIFLPVYISSGCYTMPQYLKMRFGGKRISIGLSVIYQIITIISLIAGQLYAGAVFIQQIFHWPLYPSICLILGVTAIFTIIGGLNVVIWTDTIQTAILLIGAFCVTGFALLEVGGFQAMKEQFLQAGPNYTGRDVGLYGNHTCGLPPDDSFHIFRAADSGDYPWPGMVLGLTILAVNAWCTDQTSVQRSLSAKNMIHAKAGVTLAAYLKVLSFVFFIIPGMISRVLYPDEVGCADPDICEKEICGSRSGCTDIAYPLLVLRILPSGIRGIMLAALLSALISSLTSYFNSSSTVFTVDLYPLCRPKSKEAERMAAGRLWVVFLAMVGTAWLPILEALKGSQFWSYTQSIASFLNPPIVMTFLFGIFWKRATEQGVFWGLVVGWIVGGIRMGLDWSRVAPVCGSNDPDNRFLVVSKVHYLHFAIILSAVTSIVIIVVSLFTKPRPEEKLRRVTWWTRHTKELQELSDDEESDTEEENIKTIKINDDTYSNKSFTKPLSSKKVTEIITDDKSQNSTKGNTNDDTKSEKSDNLSHNGEIKMGCGAKLRNLVLKWFCGVDKSVKPSKLTKSEIRAIQLKSTSINEDPFWKKIVNINGVICAIFCIFLHGFWF